MASKRISRGVCGSVGSGKSSFISCILGEISKIDGEVSRNFIRVINFFKSLIYRLLTSFLLFLITVQVRI
ncbi:putative ABC-type xenobiotic transporter [Helianthus anomalus]